MSPFIRLANPAVCCQCRRIIRAGRLALFEMSSFTCYTCSKKRGEAIEDPEEEEILKGLVDELDTPVTKRRGGT